jgi:hypothetical protein
MKEMNMTREEFWVKWSVVPVISKKTKKLYMKDLDDVIYTVAMEAIKKAEEKISKGK